MKKLTTLWYLFVNEIKSRITKILFELKDVKKALKNVISQSKDVIDASKGKKRRGRPKKK
jgi:hypothetical protein|tara:strand:+ start:2470 stop:2649 length:180 start_codon:yes stop_codon:yes gene_type:complete